MEEMNELFYRDPYCREFDAVVVSCETGKKGYEVVLEDTAFYPEGGGQPADQGMLDEVHVTDVRKKNGVIIHYTDGPLEVGRTVHGSLDWERRFDHMQQHTGEHILSGLIHARFGYENVGFHMGDETVLVDFDGPMSWEELMEVEAEANLAVYRNEPVQVAFPEEETRKDMEYRSKIELSGRVRIVTVPGCDVCACCGTHVHRTGEIGMIKCLSLEKHKSGVRITMVSGLRAYHNYRLQLAQNTAVSHLLSARMEETAAAVEALRASALETGRTAGYWVSRYLKEKAAGMEPQDYVFMAEEKADVNALREFGNDLLEKGLARICLLVRGTEADGAHPYLLMSVMDLKEEGRLLNQRLNGRGGGKAGMIQGTFNAGLAEIETVAGEVLRKAASRF